MCVVNEAVYIGIIVVLWAALLVFACRRRTPVTINVPEFRMREMPAVLDTESDDNASSPISKSHRFRKVSVDSLSDNESNTSLRRASP